MLEGCRYVNHVPHLWLERSSSQRWRIRVKRVTRVKRGIPRFRTVGGTFAMCDPRGWMCSSCGCEKSAVYIRRNRFGSFLQ